MARQAEIHHFSRMSTKTKIKNFFRGGLLVQLKENENFHLDGVSYPYVRREVKLFAERISSQSRIACDDGLTATSLSRPTREQPSNASNKSVHPMGMAIDFRVPSTKKCRIWFEKTLLNLEGLKVIEATRERRPPHYHVAVFPNPYKEYIDSIKNTEKEKKKTKVLLKNSRK
jgi:hypothetical protein